MKANFSKKILAYLILAGMVTIAATSPFFLHRLIKIIFKSSKYNNKKISNAFNYLRRSGMIEIVKDGHDIKIIPTEKGIKAHKRYKILELKIKKPGKWDGKIRVVAFDIQNKYRIKRDAFRKKLKELGFYSMQKSVWLHPFDCRREIKILVDFFGLGNKDISFFVSDSIDDLTLLNKIKSVYKLG